MALQHLRSSTANKRPLATALSDGQLAVNTEATSPGLFFKNASGSLVKVGPVHVGATAPNVSPASGGETGNTVGEQWLDTSGTNPVLKIWDGSGWASEIGEFVSASGDTMTGTLVMDNQQQIRFRETTANGTNYIAIQAPASVASDKTLTLPDVTGTLVSTGDTGTVTSTMIANGTIVDADINASAAITHSKLASVTAGSVLMGNASNVATATAVTGDVTISSSGVTAIASGAVVDADVNANAAIAHTKLANITAGSVLMGNVSNVPTATALTGDVTVNSSGVTAISTGAIVDADVNVSAAIAGTKISPNFGSQTVTTTGVFSAAAGAAATPSVTFTGDLNTGIYSPGADQVAISTAGTGRLFVDGSGNVGVGMTPVDVAGFNSVQLSDSNGTYFDFYIGATQQARIISLPNDFRINQITSGTLGLWTNNTERLRITSTGALNFTGAGTAGVTQAVSFNGSAPVNSLVIDSSGRLLVGTSTTSSENCTLQVRNNSALAAEFFTSSDDAGGPFIHLTKSRGTAASPTEVSSGDTLGAIAFLGYDGAAYRTGARILAQADETWTDGGDTTDNPCRLVFSTTADGASSPTERMRIGQDGGTHWRSNAATATHDLGNFNTSITGEVITVSAYRNTVNDTFKFLTCVRQGFAVALEIRDDGDVYNVNGTYGSLSDAKLKENIVDAQSQWDDIKQLRVRNYNFKPATNNSTHKQIGVIAQEIENVSPGLVNTVSDRDENGNDLGTVTKSVNYSVLYMKAVKALQEAMERIETLEAKVAALEAQ